MNEYNLEVTLRVAVLAPSANDAASAIEDVFGPGEVEGLDLRVTSFNVKEV